MNQIANWTPQVRQHKLAQAQAVADYNKKHFFSQEFFDLVINELKTNLKSGFDSLELCNNYTKWIAQWQELLAYPEVTAFLNSNQNNKRPTAAQVDFVMQFAQNKL